jgi:hypothetical protein
MAVLTMNSCHTPLNELKAWKGTFEERQGDANHDLCHTPLNELKATSAHACVLLMAKGLLLLLEVRCDRYSALTSREVDVRIRIATLCGRVQGWRQSSSRP